MVDGTYREERIVRIGIDASRAFHVERTGIEEYAYQVITHLRTPLENEEVTLFVREGQERLIFGGGFNLPRRWFVKAISWQRFWTQCGLSLEMLRGKVETLLMTAHRVPIIHPYRTVVVVHGLEHEYCPHAYSLLERLYTRYNIRHSCRAAVRVITVSENTKRDLMRLYGVPEEKLTVIYEGTNTHNAPYHTSCTGVESTLSTVLQNKYLLFIGRLEERKNITTLITAFDILKEKYCVPHKLVLAGRPGYGYEKINNQKSKSKYKEDIFALGFVSAEEKDILLRNADVFVYPSLYEGFGLPILEAQAVGVPVVTTRISSLPEVAGESALLVSPCVPEEIAEATWKLLSDKALQGDIKKKGFANTQRFSWEKCATQIAEILVGSL